VSGRDRRGLAADPGQLYVRSGLADLGVPDPELHACFAGQQNGLCGGAVPGCLLLITGLHTGTVGLVVELHDRPSPGRQLGGDRRGAVPARGRGVVVGWAGEWQRPLALIETDYRVRYCGTGMDAGRAADTRADDEPELNVAWITPALAAMDRGEPLPPPFDDDRLDNCLQQAMAFPALFSALERDLLRAALDALWSAAWHSATAGTRCCSEVRQAFHGRGARGCSPQPGDRTE
jgi:hypothetical protein